MTSLIYLFLLKIFDISTILGKHIGPFFCFIYDISDSDVCAQQLLVYSQN